MKNRVERVLKNISLWCFLIIFLGGFVAANIPGTWRGFVKINDKYAPKGTIIQVYKNYNLFTTVETGTIETAEAYYYLINIEGEIGDNISFKVNNFDASQGIQQWSVADHKLNLSINDTIAPDIIFSTPSGKITTITTLLNITTNENSICRYGTSDKNYSILSNAMNTTSYRTHNAQLSGLSDQAYTYFVRCNDTSGNLMTVSTAISFIVDTTGNWNYTESLNKGWNTLYIPDTGVLGTMGFNISDEKNILNISNFLTKTGHLENNYNAVYYNIDGSATGWRTFMPDNWALSDLQWINNSNDKPYWINMSVADRFEI